MSYMPSVSTMPTHQPPQNWATRLLPAKVQKKREKNYEKRALKKIQEDQISNAPRCESLPSVKVSQSICMTVYLLKHIFVLVHNL